MKPALLACVVAVAGCAARIEVRELASSQYCNTPGPAARVHLLRGAAAVAAWYTERGIALAGAEPRADADFAVVEAGMRPTGGYGIEVAEQATQRGERIVLDVTFFGPEPGSLQTQALSSPCALVQLPPGRHIVVEVRTTAGTVVAASAAPPAPVPGVTH
ncbi:MAG: protease complex subunit PrcB family protein [Gammaproteobacteria bacterium]